jgi:alkylation response protein AidB-like acyl-CoA dehydrogenase
MSVYQLHTTSKNASGRAVGAPGDKQDSADRVAPDCHGFNFFDLDHSLQSLLTLYLPEDLRNGMTPHYQRLGELAGKRLDDLSRLADRHAPQLHNRDRQGRDEDWLEYHSAYHEMERIAYSELGLACMSRKEGVLGWPEKIPPMAKYVFVYLFGQSEFGQLCPISMTDTSAMLVERYADQDLKDKFLDRMGSQDMDSLFRACQFMTESGSGSDVSGLEVSARQENGQWRLYGDKWFCSAPDAEVALVLARPEGAPEGNHGLAAFVMPRVLDDGSRNHYRTVRLKNKLGTRSMGSGEVHLEGALAYPMGDVGAKKNRGLKMFMYQVSMSRLSHGVRAAAMMRRCFNEAMVVASNRCAFKTPLIEKPLMRRQLMKIMLPTEQSLSMLMFVASTLHKAQQGDDNAETLSRILTPLLKFRACRDNIAVATGAMEVRGGNGYIEEWVNARLVRDAHVGLLWEGTSNINALDVCGRAVAKVGAHHALSEALTALLDQDEVIPERLRKALHNCVKEATQFADQVGESGEEILSRQVATALYHVTTAVLFASEGAQLGQKGGDARRLLLSNIVLERRILPQNLFNSGNTHFDEQATRLLLSDEPVSLESALVLLSE